MAEKILSTRIALKIDTLENWKKSTLPLKKGELALATVAAEAGTGLTEPVVMLKVGEDGVKTFSQLDWNVYAKAADVLAACKSEDALKTFVNGVIADAGIASSDAMEALASRVTTVEGEITTLKGDENTAGSVAKAIKDAIDALDLANTYVAKEDGKSLVADTEIVRLADMSDGANKVEASENGKIKIDGVDTVVYTHPEKHAIADVDGLQYALDGKQAAGDYAAEVHTHVKADITDFAHDHTASEITDFTTEVAKVKVTNAGFADEATKASQDGNGKVIADTYAEKATTLAGYSIGDAYTKTETESKITEAINTFTSAYITSDGGAIDKLQEIADWIDSDKNGSADIIADVEANAEAIEAINDTDTGILKQAKDYTDDEIKALSLGTMSKETATDYVKKSEAVGYDDILTKTAAQSAYQAKGEYYTKSEADAAFTDSTEVDNQIDAKITALDLANTYQAKGEYAAAEHSHAIGDVTGLQDALNTKANDADLKAVAKSGLIDDLSIGEGTVLIFDCGDANV